MRGKAYTQERNSREFHNTVVEKTKTSVLPLLIIVLFIIQSCTASRYETGYSVASWYGAEFHGKPTSSGELYDMYTFTCAHREYPFGTRLKIINLSNNRSVICLVNDRGPFVAGRDVDLSYAAAKEIGLIGPGTSRVWIQYIGRDNSYRRELQYLSGQGPFTLQAGSFMEKANADRLKMALSFKYSNVYLTEADIGGKKFYRVRIGEFHYREEAVKLGQTLAEEGYRVVVTTYEDKI